MIQAIGDYHYIAIYTFNFLPSRALRRLYVWVKSTAALFRQPSARVRHGIFRFEEQAERYPSEKQL